MIQYAYIQNFTFELHCRNEVNLPDYLEYTVNCWSYVLFSNGGATLFKTWMYRYFMNINFQNVKAIAKLQLIHGFYIGFSHANSSSTSDGFKASDKTATYVYEYSTVI